MAIGTSGVSVPSLGQNIDASIYGNQNAPKPLTIADMLDISGKTLELQKKKALLPSEIETGKATAKKATAEADTSQLANYQSHLTNVIQDQQRLINNPDLTAQDIIDSVKTHAKNAGTPDNVVQQTLSGLPAGGNEKQLKAWLAQNMARSLTAQGQLEALYPKVSQVDVGGNIVSTATGNQLLSAEQPGVPTGPYLQKSLAPQVATSPTGAPMAFGGGGVPQAGNLENRPVSVQAAPVQGGGANVTNMPSNVPARTTAPASTGGVTAQAMSQPKGSSAVPYIAGEPYDAFRTRAGEVSKMLPTAQKALNINEPDAVPNQRYTNEKIQKLLDDPSLDIGAISNAIANKTGGIGLNDKQQEIIKYLEQRIRYESARSNQDQSSQRSAFGSFGTNRGALREIIYKDNGNLMGQELYQRGLLNHGGDINKPNLQSVNQFNNDYSKVAEPKVVHLISVIGDKSVKDLTKADKQHLAKEFSGMSDAQIQELMNKRQKLLDLVGK